METREDVSRPAVLMVGTSEVEQAMPKNAVSDPIQRILDILIRGTYRHILIYLETHTYIYILYYYINTHMCAHGIYLYLYLYLYAYEYS